MKIDVPIPSSAATNNRKMCLWILAIGLLMVLFELPSWVSTLVFVVSGAFFLSMVMCILDIQEFKVKQNQKIIELLSKVVDTTAKDKDR